MGRTWMETHHVAMLRPGLPWVESHDAAWVGYRRHHRSHQRGSWRRTVLYTWPFHWRGVGLGRLIDPSIRKRGYLTKRTACCEQAGGISCRFRISIHAKDSQLQARWKRTLICNSDYIKAACCEQVGGQLTEGTPTRAGGGSLRLVAYIAVP